MQSVSFQQTYNVKSIAGSLHCRCCKHRHFSDKTRQTGQVTGARWRPWTPQFVTRCEHQLTDYAPADDGQANSKTTGRNPPPIKLQMEL